MSPSTSPEPSRDAASTDLPPITQHDVDVLQSRLEGLRGTMVRQGSDVKDRVDALRRDTDRLLARSAGTDFEPAMQSVADLLDCLRRGLGAQAELNQSNRAVA